MDLFGRNKVDSNLQSTSFHSVHCTKSLDTPVKVPAETKGGLWLLVSLKLVVGNGPLLGLSFGPWEDWEGVLVDWIH